jgi:mannose-6-phosphate isomerase-like protein (cupin superfamily)
MKKPLPTFEIPAILRDLPHLDLTSDTTAAAAADAFRMLAPFGDGGLIIGGFTGRTPWELHPETDELLYALEGEVEVTILAEGGEQHGILRQGSACIVPKGLWHRQFAPLAVKLLTISGPGPVSWADDPRSEPSKRS